MITRILGAAVAAALIASAAPSAEAADANGKFAIRGAGTVACSAYVGATPEQKAYAQTWWAGYLTAMNRVTPNTHHILGELSPEAADQWLMTYCQQNPGENFATAVHEMLKAAYPNRTQTGE